MDNRAEVREFLNRRMDILVETNVRVPMRDGVRLATDIYRTAQGSPAPVLLARTPYDKQWALAGAGVPFDIMRAVRAGYAVVVQDVRGRYASEGTFNPHFQEADDSLDTLVWVAGQPWSAGVVGTFGGSYLGGTQWSVARHKPPALRAMAPAVTPSDMYEGTAYQGGAHVLHGLRWAVSIAPEELQRRGQAVPADACDLDVDAVLSHRPLGDHPPPAHPSTRRRSPAGDPPGTSRSGSAPAPSGGRSPRPVRRVSPSRTRRARRPASPRWRRRLRCSVRCRSIVTS